MRPENKRMQEFLKNNGIKCHAKWIPDGSLKHTWHLWNTKIQWTSEIWDKLNGLGFHWIDGKPLGEHMGNGGVLSVCVYGHHDIAA